MRAGESASRFAGHTDLHEMNIFLNGLLSDTSWWKLYKNLTFWTHSEQKHSSIFSVWRACLTFEPCTFWALSLFFETSLHKQETRVIMTGLDTGQESTLVQCYNVAFWANRVHTAVCLSTWISTSRSICTLAKFRSTCSQNGGHTSLSLRLWHKIFLSASVLFCLTRTRQNKLTKIVSEALEQKNCRDTTTPLTDRRIVFIHKTDSREQRSKFTKSCQNRTRGTSTPFLLQGQMLQIFVTSTQAKCSCAPLTGFE